MINDQKPTAQIVLFPMAKRVGKIRRAAEVLTGKSRDEAGAYWRQIVSTNRRQFDRLGISEHTGDAELRAFFAALQAELNRPHCSDENQGGAA